MCSDFSTLDIPSLPEFSRSCASRDVEVDIRSCSDRPSAWKKVANYERQFIGEYTERTLDEVHLQAP